MHRHRIRLAVASLAAAILLGAAPRERASDAAKSDALADDVARWSRYVRENAATDEMWTQVKPGAEAALARVAEALRDGHRLLALQRLSAARASLAAYQYLAGRPEAERRDEGRFEAEWKRVGLRLRPDFAAVSPDAYAGVAPAALRALAEAAQPQVRVYYDASLEYGRSTTPESGLFYIGTALAQKDFADLCRRLSATAGAPAPALRSLASELDALEGDLLAAYRPPASLERHAEFIVASAAIKEARELDAAGLRYGALLRYLQAALRVAPLRSAGSAVEIPGPRGALLAAFDARLASSGTDDSIGRLFLEMARADASGAPVIPSPGSPPPGGAASAIASDVLPRYFAALGPGASRQAPAAPQVTVTLVRWPYT